METGKPGLASAPVHNSSVAAQTEKRMDIQAPLTAVYINTVPGLPAQPYTQLPAAARDSATLHLAMPPLHSKETLPFLTLHIAGGLQSVPGLSLAVAAPTARAKLAGKHVCPHCGRDCMKPSVLEKHLRCHTGERPYPCTTCGVSFKTQSNLYKHKRTQAHARLSSESEQSSLGSLDSVSSSRETHTSSFSLDEHSEALGSVEKDATVPADIVGPANDTKVYSVKTQRSVNEQNEFTTEGHKTEPNEAPKVTKEEEKLRVENEKPPVTVSRHLTLQRQEATLFSKQWESSVSSGKSQSHESTDSGFSESSDHYPSPGSVLLDQSMDSLTESNKEHLEETGNAHALSEPGHAAVARELGQRTLEERISRLISENTAVVEDKQLENVRPRKTVLSKQGSIDLPMPYTYKDSFHFDMRKSNTPNVGSQRNRRPGLYSSVPTQHCTTMEHAPLTRSNSLPFSVTLVQPDRSSPTSQSDQSDYVTLFRRGSSGQINPTGFTIKPVNQQSSTHRPLVRQTAVDCNHATDGLSMNSSVEEACTSSLSYDGNGSDICGEPSNRKFRRRKAQKFAYNKWYMYGDGTFKKLYNSEKGVDNSVNKGRKCMHPEQEVVQGPQKRSSAFHKEKVTTTGSTLNITTTSAAVCHSGCPPAGLSLVSAVGLTSNQLQSSCSSLKAPLRRNMSLSILPLPSTGSLVSHKTDSLSSKEAGRLITEEKHYDSDPQLCGANVPSNRKKQRTDDKIICPLEMETDPNTLTHPPLAITGSTPQQDTNLSYINLQKKQKPTQLKGDLLSPCIINVNTPSVTSSPATSIPSAAKTSFLPKYQLKLPNAVEPNSNTSLHVVDTPKGTDGCTVTSALSSSQNEQTSLSVTTSEKRCSDAIASPLMQACDIKKINASNSTQAQLLVPCTATTLCQAETSRFNKYVTSNLPLVHRQLAATTITTTCLHEYQAALCSTTIQPSKSAATSVPIQSPRRVAPVVANFPPIPRITTANNQTSAVTLTAFSQLQLKSNPSLSHSQPSPAPDQLNPVNGACAGQNSPNGTCQILPFDQVQPAAQNVFHVHTADLQICLQIISDEQLALIEPQIERQAGSSLSQRRDMAALASDMIQNKAQSLGSMGSSNEGRGHQQLGHQRDLDQSKSLPTVNMKSIKIPLSVHFEKAQQNMHMTEHSNSSQATVSAETKSPEALGLTLCPHKYSHVNMVTETLSSAGNVMSTAASLEGVQSGRGQTSEEELALSPKHCAEEQLFLDRRASQGDLVLQTLPDQHKLSMTCLSPNAVNQNSTRSELRGKEIQKNLKNHGATCNAGIMKATGEASAYKSSRLESGETHPSLQVKFTEASGGAGANDPTGSVSPFSSNKYKAQIQLNPQVSTYCSSPLEPILSETLNPSKHANRGCDRVVPLHYSTPLQEMTLSESQDVISLARLEKQLGQFTSASSNIQVEKTKDLPAVPTSIQRPTEGLLEGASLVGFAGQKEPQTWGHGGNPALLDSKDWRPKQSQEAGEMSYPALDGKEGRGVMREDKNGGIEKDHVPGQWGNATSNCRYMVLPDMTKPEREEREVKGESFKNSRLSEQHLHHLSSKHSTMSEYPPQSPKQAPSILNSSSQTSLNSPQPPMEINNFHFSHQHWESSIIHNQQKHCLSEANSNQLTQTQAQSTETQNAFSRFEPCPQQTSFSHQDQKQDPRQTLSVQQGDTTSGINSTGESCCARLTLASPKNPSLLTDVKTSSVTHHCQASHSPQVSRTTAGWTGTTQVSKNNMLDNNTGSPSKPFPYHEPEQDTKDQEPDDYITQSSNSWRPDFTNKYQSFFLTGQLHGYQPVECVTSGVRPVQSCQDNSEETSSSDDEGKLIIEL